MKKRYWLIYIVFIILLIGLIPVDLLLFNIPSGVMIGGVVILAAFLIWLWWKAKSRRLTQILISFLTVIIMSTALFGVYCNPYWNSYSMKLSEHKTKAYDSTIRYKQAKEDLDYVVKVVRKDHPLFLNSTPKDFSAAYDQAVSALKESDKITVNLLWQNIQRVLATLQDGHTCAYASYPEYHYLKYIAKMREDNYHLVEVNGIPMERLFDQTKDRLSYDTKSWGMEMLGEYLTSLEGLCFLGIDPSDKVLFTYGKDDGSVTTLTCNPKDFLTYDEYMKYNNITDTNNTKDSFVSYTIDAEKSLALLTLTSCRYNQEYRDCLKKMFAEIMDKNIQNVAVDLRKNGGGNSMVADEFLRYLNIEEYKVPTYRLRLGFLTLRDKHNVLTNHKYKEETFTGKVYLLTSASTFSSAMDFAQYIKDNQLGTIIGEAPGNDAYGYGEVGTFQMPNSRLYFQVSIKQFYRADLSVKDKLITPDISCESTDALNRLYEELEQP